MVISKPETVAAPPNGAATGTSAAAAAADLDAGSNSLAHPSGIPQDQIDNIMSGISNTGDVRMNNHRKKLRQRFDIIKKLGQGTYGKVQLGINKETGQEVAIKTIKKCKIEAEADLVRIRREVQIMSSVQHPNIIHIYEVFENREKMVLVMEFAAGGELYDYLSERKVLNEEEARRIFRQVATAVYYCHKHKICHRDLKLENILLDEKGNAKIADFGLSNVFDAGRLLGTFCGSPLYASPEIVEGTPYQGPEVDCWSLGVLLYTLVYGSMPFDGSNFKRLVKQISQGDYYEPRKPSRASTLIRDMLTVCPRKRATIEQICSHWWVNENDNVSCLDLAEDLANQTPVRLDVLLSLTPATITADQMVVPSAEGAAAAAKAAANERVPRSHSVGSIRDMGPPNTEAERRILDMVAAGGEAALMPSPTRTITPAQSPVQTKRKLQPTVSTENAAGTTAKKKEKPANSSFVISGAAAAAPPPPTEPMRPAPAPPTLMEAETIGHIPEEKPRMEPCFSQKDMQMVGDLCEQLMEGEASGTPTPTPTPIPTPAPVTAAPPVAVSRQPTRGKLDAVAETPEEKDATKVIKKFVNKHKTADLVNAINESATASGKVVPAPATGAVGAATSVPPFVRKCSLQDESTLNKFNAERRKSRILETAEKFQPPPPVTTGPGSQAATEKPKKLSIPGVSVGSFKKEFERKATNPPATAGPTPGELRAQEQVAAAAAAAQEAESQSLATPPASPVVAQSLEASDSKNSVTSISLDEARRSMENSIALLLQAQNESNKEVDQLCAQTETIGVSEPTPTREERERKLKNARAIIGNAIQPASPGADGQPGTPGAVKTSTASITLKSATLPRRKINAKSEVQLEIKPRIPEQAPQPAMRFSTEMQHPVADLRSAPPREGPIPYSPIKTTLPGRATSLEPKEHVITIQRPPTQHAYGRTSSNTTTRSGSLSRQSTVESESDATTTTATNMSQATVTGQGTSQPIKKSPREFIIPIAVEGGGFITPRERSIEPSESSHTTASSRSTFSRLRPSRHIGSLLSEAVFDEGSPFQKMRTTSITRDGGPGAGADEEARFTPHRLRSSRPVKKISQDNDSQSSNEEDDDDDDGFEILTAENLFSTLLQRVRNLTNRLNVNSDLTVGFPSHSSRLLTDISRQAQSHSPFWSQGVSPFASVHRSQVSYTSSYSETVEKKQVRLNSGSNSGGLGAPWRHSMSRDLGSDMESMFSRTGATLPRGHHQGKGSSSRPSSTPANVEKVAPTSATAAAAAAAGGTSEEPLDLADLDLSRLRLSKKDLETLSSITPGLPKCFQEQLLAKLPPTQARKLSRTLSVQTSAPSSGVTQKPYKRSQSGGRGYLPDQPEEDFKAKPLTDAPKTTAASTAIYRRSLSRSQALAQTQTQSNQEGAQPATVSTTTSKSRSSSVCRDDYGKSSLCSSSYTSDISDKYKYYSPYLSKSSNGTTTTTTTTKEVPEKRYSAGLGRPPSGCMSPPPNGALPTSVPVAEGSSSLRGRSSQRRISRFLRPDFFDDPRDRETQNVLREIREKSSDRMEQADQRRRKHSLPNVEQADQQPTLEPGPVRSSMRHTRNKSVELFPDGEATPQQTGQTAPEASGKRSGLRQRSVSRPRELETDLDKHELADKILQELQLLSAVRTQHEQGKIPDVETDKTEETSTIRKVKKVKPKEAASNDAEASKLSTTTTTTTTTLVRKVKKVSRKTDEPKTPSTETAATEIPVPASTPKETRLKRPKSYPMKDLGLSLKSPTELPEPSSSASAMPSKLPSKLPSAAGNESQTGESAPRESRLMRPKSYPATKLATPKELRKVTRSGAAIPTISEASPAVTAAPSATGTPVSSKSTSEEKSLSATPTGTMSNVTDTKDTASSSSDSRPTTIKKIIKVSKKSKLVPPTPVTPTTTPSATTTTNTTATTTPADSSKESSPVIKTKEKSPEKKSSKGLLYALGQKFEKLRDSAMSKDRKTATSGGATTLACTQKQGSPEERSSPEKATVLRKKKSLEPEKSIELPAEDKRVDKRSRFDSMLRSLRERSVPRSQSSSRASPKRAASVEELHAGDTDAGTGKQSGAVNKMFGGLLRRFDRESSEQRRVRSTRSTSNIERQVREEQDALLPTSPIYQNVVKAKPTVLPPGASEENCNCETACPDCRQNQGQANSLKPNSTSSSSGATPSIKEKRKGLMLDLASAQGASGGAASAVTTATTTTSGSSYRGSKTNPALINGNGGMGLYSNLPPYPGAVKSASSNNSSSQQSVENATNNNSTNTNNNCSSQTSGYRTSSAHEINRNNPLLTPSFENIANYSSDSRSYQDDCASTSTFLSPTEEPELYFDNWSICSEDNFMLHATPSPTVSRLSRASLSSPTRCSESSDPNESVIDRIKRRSFYSRFNEQKKPRRTSSIVGPSAVRDYYREQQAAVKARSSHKLHVAEVEPRAHSPDIAQQFFRPLKLSPVGTELKPPMYRSPLDYSTSSSGGATSKPRKSLNDIRNTSPSFLSKRYEVHDYSSVPMRYKSSSSSSPSNGAIASGYYNTYNPKRRSSYTLNGSLPTASSSSAAGSSHLDGYATLGRRSIRPYDHRTMSLLEPPTTSSSSAAGSSAYQRREARTPVRDYTSSISRSGSRYRTSSATRSPTNI
ncbi:serine-rich adhesin for platelets isoform X4 [Drosophila subobscura]|uniref:serine-rich adhesin for platelets isoform X4 n=1 Tax=Drosophila subobscura TaxID=7241 RepID=UPI00155A92E6|nr:serine-rich adhesin for platelets isoform X4 [Drosophila subobscura]